MVNSVMSFNNHGPELMAEAERIVKPQYPTAVQVENFGTSSRGSAGTAEEIDQWKFVFTDIDGLETITLDYAQGKFGKAVREPRPWIKTLIKELPRNLPLSQALSYLRNAGYNEPTLVCNSTSALSSGEGGDLCLSDEEKDCLYGCTGWRGHKSSRGGLKLSLPKSLKVENQKWIFHQSLRDSKIKKIFILSVHLILEYI